MIKQHLYLEVSLSGKLHVLILTTTLSKGGVDSATIMLRVVQCIHSHVRTAMKLIWSTEWNKTSNIAGIAADMQHDVAG